MAAFLTHDQVSAVFLYNIAHTLCAVAMRDSLAGLGGLGETILEGEGFSAVVLYLNAEKSCPLPYFHADVSVLRVFSLLCAFSGVV